MKLVFFEIKIAAQSGCDSIYGVTINEVPPVSNLDTLVICENDSIEIFGQWVSDEIILSETFQGISGCDSVQSFQVLKTPLPHQPLHFDICESDSVFVGNQWFTEAGFYETTVSASVGCDTVFEIEIEEIPLLANSDTLYFCEGDSVQVFGQWVKDNAFLSEIFTSSIGCDSSQSFQVIESALAQESVSYELCSGDSVQVGGEWFADWGMHSLVVASLTGCDTLYQVELLESAPIVLSNTFSICQGDSVQVGNEWLSDTGSYSILIDPLIGCDTLYEVEIMELLPVENTENISICEGDSILIFGNVITAAGEYSQVFTGMNGCDSTHIIFVGTIPLESVSDTLQLCEGDSMLINNQWVNTNGIYVDTIDSQPCKTIQFLWVEMQDTASTNETMVLCPGDSIFINNQWIKEPTEISLTNINSNGCDSTHTIQITAWPNPDAPIVEVDCSNLQISANITAAAPWQIIWSNGDTTQQTVFQNEGTASVSLFAVPDCEVDFTLSIPSLPDTALLPNFDDQFLNEGIPFSINLDLDASEWQVQWSPSSIFACDTCLVTEIFPTENTLIEATYIHSSGCIYTNSFQINIQSENGVYIPSAFSPNGDQINDVWTAFHADENILFEEVVIFGRWGNMVASWNGVTSFEWDGTSGGRLLDAGVYVFHMRYLDGNGKVVEREGEVILIR